MTGPGSSAGAPDGHLVRLASIADAPFMKQCHIECLAETYAHIMPAAFAQHRRDHFSHETAELRAEIGEMEQALAAGREPRRRHWLAIRDGEVVGVVASGPGRSAWEEEFCSHPTPPVEWNLDHLYTRASTHGSGLGQHLLELALADERGAQRAAWLWILRENPRAEAFYRRNGFVDEGLETRCGASWFGRPMFRMWRAAPTS